MKMNRTGYVKLYKTMRLAFLFGSEGKCYCVTSPFDDSRGCTSSSREVALV